ncbi:MAG: isoprenylcysteine carboxylmethyltransferase family protein [Actinomycetota bacterium]
MDALELRVPPPVWAVVFGAIAYGIALLELGLEFSISSSRLGIAIGFVGVVIAVFAIIDVRAEGTTIDPHHPDETSALVQKGMYRFTRNPMYLGLALVIAGIAVGHGDILATIVGVGGFATVVTRLQIIPEERALRARFGTRYDEYCEGPRRWI